MKIKIAILSSIALCSCLFSSVPLRWTVETSRVQPVSFDAYHGETVELEASFQSYGKPFSTSIPAALWYQTNGMGSAWWSVPATVSSNAISAVFGPSDDPGAPLLNCFLGGTASTYRAAFQLRFRNSPGKSPNILDLPKTTYDAALFGEPTINGTNLAEWVAARSQAESDPVFREWVRTNDFSTSSGGTSDYNQLLNKPQINGHSLTGNLDSASLGLQSAIAIFDGTYDIKVEQAKSADEADYSYSAVSSSFADYASKPESYESWQDMIDTLVGSYYTLKSYAETNYFPMALGNAWQTYWDGDDVRVTVTNYYGSAGIPSLYIEQKMETNETHATPWFKTIWDERTRWNGFLEGYQTLTNSVANDLADRAWGVYDSSTGSYSPDGLLQLSQDQIMISSGMAYQKTVTAGGCAVWVLKATEPTTLSGVSSNGFFRIEDGDGNALFEIVKGDKRVVGATATGISMSGNVMTITYNSVSAEHPTLEICTDLRTADWASETATTVATVTWGGESGAWVATVTPVGARNSLFAKATFEAGGNTYIKNNVASSLDKVVVGGIEYTVSVETVNGKKLMVLHD